MPNGMQSIRCQIMSNNVIVMTSSCVEIQLKKLFKRWYSMELSRIRFYIALYVIYKGTIVIYQFQFIKNPCFYELNYCLTAIRMLAAIILLSIDCQTKSERSQIARWNRNVKD